MNKKICRLICCVALSFVCSLQGMLKKITSDIGKMGINKFSTILPLTIHGGGDCPIMGWPRTGYDYDDNNGYPDPISRKFFRENPWVLEDDDDDGDYRDSIDREYVAAYADFLSNYRAIVDVTVNSSYVPTSSDYIEWCDLWEFSVSNRIMDATCVYWNETPWYFASWFKIFYGKKINSDVSVFHIIDQKKRKIVEIVCPFTTKHFRISINGAGSKVFIAENLNFYIYKINNGDFVTKFDLYSLMNDPEKDIFNNFDGQIVPIAVPGDNKHFFVYLNKYLNEKFMKKSFLFLVNSETKTIEWRNTVCCDDFWCTDVFWDSKTGLFALLNYEDPHKKIKCLIYKYANQNIPPVIGVGFESFYGLKDCMSGLKKIGSTLKKE